MNRDLSLSQALGGLRIANPDDGTESSPALPSPTSSTYGHGSSGSKGALSILPVQDIDPAKHHPHREGFVSASRAAQGSEHVRTAIHDSSSVSYEGQAVPSSVPTSVYPSQDLSQEDLQRSYDSSRSMPTTIASGNLPRRRSSRGVSVIETYGSYPARSAATTTPPFPRDAPPPTNSEEWKDRGAAVGIRRELDANGRMVMRQIKKGVRDFTFGRILGEGSYSTVYTATDRQTLKEYAVKVLEKKHIIKENKIKYVKIEKDTLNRLTEHPGIVRLYYTFQDEASLYYVLDMCIGGELLGVLKKTGSFSPECTRFYGAQILDAIDYMHSRGVIHRDLKPENVLLDDTMHIKITDFGTAKLLQDPRERTGQDSPRGVPEPSIQGTREDGRATSFVGTAEYVSPELLTQKIACKASDLWAYGCIIYQLLAGRPPFKAATEYLTFQKIVGLDYQFPPGFPSAARDLVERCLVLDPTRRLTVEHIKNHEFFDGQTFGKQLWRMKAPKLRAYIPPSPEPTVIQLNGYSQSSTPTPVASSRHHPPQGGPSQSSSSRPARIITELPPPSQLDIEWSPVLTRNNERILKLGDLMVISSSVTLSPSVKTGDDGHKKLSRFFGGNTTKKRQRLVMVTSTGRILLAPSGGEEKRSKQEISLLASDASWRTQRDAKGHIIWCVDSAGTHYSFEEVKGSESHESTAEAWVQSVEKAKEMAISQGHIIDGEDEGFGDMSSSMSSPASTFVEQVVYQGGYNVGDRSGRNHFSKSQNSLDDSVQKRNRFSKRSSRNGLGSAF